MKKALTASIQFILVLVLVSCSSSDSTLKGDPITVSWVPDDGYYDEETLTDQPMRQIAAEIIREKALRLLNEEVPHGIAVDVEAYREREDGLTEIEASVICEKESHKGIIIGKGGSMLKRIGSAARREIEEMTGGKVYLKLFVKVRRDWRDDSMMLRSLGYSRK